MKLFPLVSKKVAIWTIVGAAAAGTAIFLISKNGGEKETLVVHLGDFVQQISVSGKVVAAQSVDLVFSQTGRTSGVYAKVGDIVSAGKVLASLENGDIRAEVLQKEAAYEAAQAKLKSLKEGTRPEQLAVTASSVASAEAALAQANQALIDALRNSYTQSDDAIRRRVDQFISNPQSSQPTVNISISSQLKSDIESGRVSLESLLASWKGAADSLTSSSDTVVAVGQATKNLDRIRTFLDLAALALSTLSSSSNLSQATLDGYRADITTARTNINTAVSTLTTEITDQKNAETALVTAKRKLELERAGATATDIAEEEATVKAAEAELQSARAKFQKTLVVAPFTGVVTRMDAKVGGSASSNTSEISMISAETLQIESFVPELNAPLIKVGDEAVATLDAYGEDVPFAARVVSIDPAETVRDGVSTYRTKLQFVNRDERIKSGMTASIVITTERKSNVIALPQGAVFERDGRKIVYVQENGKATERSVTTGSVSSLGTVEIISGLREDDVVLLDPEK